MANPAGIDIVFLRPLLPSGRTHRTASKLRKQKVTRESGGLKRFRRGVGIVGCAIAAFFFAWLLLGAVPGIPDMVDVFGTTGIRTPASITIAGLLLAAVGFFEP